jgi:hypothetical protein
MKTNEKKALSSLKRRVKYLISNTRLVNNKRNNTINKDCLGELDNHLRSKFCITKN